MWNWGVTIYFPLGHENINRKQKKLLFVIVFLLNFSIDGRSVCGGKRRGDMTFLYNTFISPFCFVNANSASSSMAGLAVSWYAQISQSEHG